MSAAQTIPMFAPDGSLGDIPIEQANAARAAGAKPAVNVLDPQGNHGYVPADRVQDAVQAGGHVLPFEQQETAAHPGILDTIKADLKGMVSNIPTVTSPYPGADLERKQQVAQQSAAEDQARQAAGYGPLYRAAAPIAEAAGTNVPGMEEAAKEGNERGVIGHAVAGAGVAAAPVVAEGAVKGAGFAADEAREGVYRATTKAATTAMPEETALLPNKAVAGAEDIIRATAPVGTNTRFRANVYAAAGDLAEIGREVNGKLKQVKGGVVQPDLRARATVDAINDHLAEMYQNERAVQINKNPGAAVPLEISDDVQSGLKVMARSGEAATRELATKALNGQLTLGEADALARGVNAELQTFERMTPEQQAAARVNQRAVAGLKATDRLLSSAIDDELQAQGQPGLHSYERRYAALSSIRDQLQKRVNSVELQRNAAGEVGRRVRSATKIVTGGPAGVASASQAAVADVNPGKLLERGLNRLSETYIKANRAIPRPPAEKPPVETPKPPQPERRGGGETGPRAQVFSDEERAQRAKAELSRVEQGGHSNPLVGNPFDRNPDFNNTIKNAGPQPPARAQQILSGQ